MDRSAATAAENRIPRPTGGRSPKLFTVRFFHILENLDFNEMMLVGLSCDAKIVHFLILTKKNHLFFKKTARRGEDGTGQTGQDWTGWMGWMDWMDWMDWTGWTGWTGWSRDSGGPEHPEEPRQRRSRKSRRAATAAVQSVQLREGDEKKAAPLGSRPFLDWL